MTATEEFDRVTNIVNEERAQVYGHPFIDFRRVADLKMVIADCPDPRMRHVLDMIAVKIARLIETPDHVDSLVDIAGYARTGCMVIDAAADKQDHVLSGAVGDFRWTRGGPVANKEETYDPDES